MLSSVLNSERVVLVNIEIMRAFVSLRQILASDAELSRRLDALESKYDRQFKVVFDAIRQLMSPPVRNRKEIGFTFAGREEVTASEVSVAGDSRSGTIQSLCGRALRDGKAFLISAEYRDRFPR
jgi:hypothetical protein